MSRVKMVSPRTSFLRVVSEVAFYFEVMVSLLHVRFYAISWIIFAKVQDTTFVVHASYLGICMFHLWGSYILRTRR